MNIKTVKLDRHIHTTRVEQNVAMRLIAEWVAAEIGLSLDSPGVSFRAHVDTIDIGTGPRDDVVVEIIEDHAAKEAGA